MSPLKLHTVPLIDIYSADTETELKLTIVEKENDFLIWGIVTHVIKKV